MHLSWGFKADPQSTGECNERQKMKETEAFLMGLWYCERIHGDKARKVTGRVCEVLNSKNESSGGNMMNPNSKVQEGGGSVTGLSNRREVEHLQQSFKDAIVSSQLKLSLFGIKKKLQKCVKTEILFFNMSIMFLLIACLKE